jgi:hypothetical protein
MLIVASSCLDLVYSVYQSNLDEEAADNAKGGMIIDRVKFGCCWSITCGLHRFMSTLSSPQVLLH